MELDLRLLRKRLERDWRRVGNWVKRAFLCALMACLHSLLFIGPVGQMLEPGMLSTWFMIRGPRPAPQTVTVVRVDDEAYIKINKFTGEAFPRDILAEGLERIGAAGPRLIILDMIMQKKFDNTIDDRLAKALAATPSIIGKSFKIVTETTPDGKQRTRKTPLFPQRVFRESAKGVIALHVLSTNGVVRQISLADFSEGVADARVPLLKPLQDFVFPAATEPGPRDFINYYGGPSTIANLSFARFLDDNPDVPMEYFKDRVVFLGFALEIAAGIEAGKDAFLTSFSKDSMYGVEIHATIAANLLDGSWIRRGSPELELVVLVVATFFATFAVASMALAGSAVFSLVFGAAWLILSYYAFSHAYLFFPGATLVLIILPLLLFGKALLAAYQRSRMIKEVLRLALD